MGLAAGGVALVRKVAMPRDIILSSPGPRMLPPR